MFRIGDIKFSGDLIVKEPELRGLVRVRQGIPLRIVFDRQESGECTSRVVFPDFALNRSLSAFAQTTVELLPDRAGEFRFACGMNMIHGKLIVEPQSNGHGATVAGAPVHVACVERHPGPQRAPVLRQPGVVRRQLQSDRSGQGLPRRPGCAGRAERRARQQLGARYQPPPPRSRSW